MTRRSSAVVSVQQPKKRKLHISEPDEYDGSLGSIKFRGEPIRINQQSPYVVPETNQGCLVFYPNTLEEPNRELPTSYSSPLQSCKNENIQNRFLLLRTVSISDDSSFNHEDEEIEYKLSSCLVSFLVPKKGHDFKVDMSVNVPAAGGDNSICMLESVLVDWAKKNEDYERSDITDIVWKKASFTHDIYSKIDVSYNLAGFIVEDTGINPMKGCRCIRTGNKRIDLYFDATYFGKVDLRMLYTDTPDNVIVHLQKQMLDSMQLASTASFGNKLPKNFQKRFCLYLLEHQIHSLAWMTWMEDIIARGHMVPRKWWLHFYELVSIPNIFPEKLLSFYTGKVHDTYPLTPSFFPRGGILANEPGSGKTVIALALLAARPAPELDLIQKSIPFSDNRNRKMASRATLIVVPGHLIDQWHEEIDKCFKEKKNVIRIANNKDYNSTSWVSVIHADIVLLSKSFYLGSYINIIWDFRQDQVIQKLLHGSDSYREEQLQMKGIIFTGFHFHRVIVDQIIDNRKEIENRKEMLLKLTGQYMWGLAGTGRWGKDEIDFVAQFTQPYLASLFKPTLQYTLLADHYVNPLCFKAHFIKSTTNCLDDLPDIKEEIIDVPRVHDLVVQPIGKKVPGSREVAHLMSLSLDDEILNLTNIVARDLQRIPCLKSHFDHIDLSSIQIGAGAFIETVLHSLTEEVKSIRFGEVHEGLDVAVYEAMGKEAGLALLTELLDKAAANTDFLSGELEKERLSLVALVESVSFKRLRAKEKEKNRVLTEMDRVLNDDLLCPICREEISKEDSLVMTDCLHVYDKGCFSRLIRSKHSCPSCRSSISPIRAVEFTAFGEDGLSVDIETFTSIEDIQFMIASVVEELRKILTVQNAKILIFTHDSAMASALHSVICLAGVNAVRFVKKADNRESSIWQYKYGAAQVLLLSPDAEFSGLNLSVSSHLFIVHSLESMGHFSDCQEIDQRVIASVYRLGLTHDLFLKRFLR